MQKYKFVDLFNKKSYKLYEFQHGGLNLISESDASKLNLQELQLVDVPPLSAPTPVKAVAPVKVESGMKLPPIIIPNPSSDKIQSLITPPPSPLTPSPPLVIIKPSVSFESKMLFEIILENLLGKPERYNLYLDDIREYLKKFKAIYIIDSENLRYKFIDKNFKKPINNVQHRESWELMFDYLSDKIMGPDNLVLLCGNTHWLYKNLNDYKLAKIKIQPQSVNSFLNVFTIYFKQINPEKNFTPSDDLIFWIFAMAFRKIIGESCNEYQKCNKGNKGNKNCVLDEKCKLHLITGDKQKIYDANVHTPGKFLKNFYTEFIVHDKTATIQFYLNNILNINISSLIKLFLSKFIEKNHDPSLYKHDPLGISFIEKCFKENCDFFEKFISNIKTLQKLYFPPCDKSCTLYDCNCAIDGKIITDFK